jgi:hypothetical protein
MTQIPSQRPGRPLCVNIEGGRLYISAHDAYHLEKQREFKRLIRAAHPDRNHCIWAAGRTRKLLQARARWEKAEARWYACLGLDPPKGGGVDTARHATAGLVPFVSRLPGSN